ncbi:MAG TPA: tetratricopeptide repeat protein, partial [Candidatus Omnitrophota bacterium]|nr:tetratricopeptide repeat protein [Candidatus Omnitrophota bacterium]
MVMFRDFSIGFNVKPLSKVGMAPERLETILERLGYPKAARPALIKEFKKLFSAKQFEALQSEALTAIRSKDVLRLGRFLRRLFFLLEQKGRLSSDKPNRLLKLLVNSLAGEDIARVIEEAAITPQRKADLRKFIFACTAISQMVYVLLTLWGVEAEGAGTSQHAAAILPLDQTGDVFIVDFSLGQTRRLRLDDHYRRKGEYLLLKPDSKTDPQRLCELWRRFEGRSLFLGTLAGREFLSLFYLSIHSAKGLGLTASILNNIGLVYDRTGQPDKAIRFYQQAVQRDPAAAEAYHNLATLYTQAGQRRKAMALYRKAIKFNPHLAEAWNNLGISYSETKEHDREIAALKRAIQVRPYYAEAYNNLGVAYADAGKVQEAVLCYETAIALQPNSFRAYRNLGDIYYSMRKITAAVRNFSKAVRISPILIKMVPRELQSKVIREMKKQKTTDGTNAAVLNDDLVYPAGNMDDRNFSSEDLPETRPGLVTMNTQAGSALLQVLKYSTTFTVVYEEEMLPGDLKRVNGGCQADIYYSAERDRFYKIRRSLVCSYYTALRNRLLYRGLFKTAAYAWVIDTARKIYQYSAGQKAADGQSFRDILSQARKNGNPRAGILKYVTTALKGFRSVCCFCIVLAGSGFIFFRSVRAEKALFYDNYFKGYESMLKHGFVQRGYVADYRLIQAPASDQSGTFRWRWLNRDRKAVEQVEVVELAEVLRDLTDEQFFAAVERYIAIQHALWREGFFNHALGFLGNYGYLKKDSRMSGPLVLFDPGEVSEEYGGDLEKALTVIAQKQERAYKELNAINPAWAGYYQKRLAAEFNRKKFLELWRSGPVLQIEPVQSYSTNAAVLNVTDRGEAKEGGDPRLESILRVARAINPAFDESALREHYASRKSELEERPCYGASCVPWGTETIDGAVYAEFVLDYVSYKIDTPDEAADFPPDIKNRIDHDDMLDSLKNDFRVLGAFKIHETDSYPEIDAIDHYGRVYRRVALYVPVEYRDFISLYLAVGEKTMRMIMFGMPKISSKEDLAGFLKQKGITGAVVDDGFFAVFEAVRRIHPRVDVRLLWEAYQEIAADFSKGAKSSPGAVVVLDIESDEHSRYGGDEYDKKETKGFFLDFLRDEMKIPGVYLREVAYTSPVREGSSGDYALNPDHYFTQHRRQSYVASREFDPLLRACVLAREKGLPIRKIFLGETDDYQQMVDEGVRLLGKERGTGVLGKKESGFLLLDRLALPYPPGIALSESLVKRICEMSGSSRQALMDCLYKKLAGIGIDTEKDMLAVRSNPKRSMPGIFTTCRTLDMKYLLADILTVANAWYSERAAEYRKKNGLSEAFDLPIIVQLWKSGESPDRDYLKKRGADPKPPLYASGVLSTRNPNNNEKKLYGRYKVDSHGEDLMTGGKEGEDVNGLETEAPDLYRQLLSAAETLEAEAGPQEIEFVVNDGTLYFVQTRKLNFSAAAEIAYIRELLTTGKITEARAIPLIEALHEKIQKRKVYKIREGLQLRPIAGALASTPGAIRGYLAFDEDGAKQLMEEGKAVIFAACFRHQGESFLMTMLDYPLAGLITSYGNGSSHEAVLCRLAGIPSLIRLSGCEIMTGLHPGIKGADGLMLHAGDMVIIDGDNGILYEAPEEDVLQENGVVFDASYGIDIPAMRKAFLTDYVHEDGTLKSGISRQRLVELNQSAVDKFKELDAKGDRKGAFTANLEKHFLHGLLDLVPESNAAVLGRVSEDFQEEIEQAWANGAWETVEQMQGILPRDNGFKLVWRAFTAPLAHAPPEGAVVSRVHNFSQLEIYFSSPDVAQKFAFDFRPELLLALQTVSYHEWLKEWEVMDDDDNFEERLKGHSLYGQMAWRIEEWFSGQNRALSFKNIPDMPSVRAVLEDPLAREVMFGFEDENIPVGDLRRVLQKILKDRIPVHEGPSRILNILQDEAVGLAQDLADKSYTSRFDTYLLWRIRKVWAILKCLEIVSQARPQNGHKPRAEEMLGCWAFIPALALSIVSQGGQLASVSCGGDALPFLMNTIGLVLLIAWIIRAWDR